jgi:hypothetical protein
MEGQGNLLISQFKENYYTQMEINILEILKNHKNMEMENSFG